MRIKNNKVVYLHIRLDTNDVFYVGIGTEKRPYSTRNRNKYWNNIVKKCGYEIKIIHTNLDWETACLLEIELIKKYGRIDLNMGTLVNHTNGGDGTAGAKLSIETCIKMSNSRIGKKHSQETIEKMKKSAMGNKNSFGVVRSDAYRINLSNAAKEVNKNPEVRLRKSESLKKYKKTKKHCKNISNSKLGKAQPISFVEKRGIAVLQCDFNGNILNEFLSLRKASEYIGGSHPSIQAVCVGRKLNYMGFIWKFK